MLEAKPNINLAALPQFLQITVTHHFDTFHSCWLLYHNSIYNLIYIRAIIWRSPGAYELADDIQSAFKDIDEEIDKTIIINALGNVKTFDVTNQFTQLTADEKNFLIRINGEL